jgi:hypothetical protein
MKEWKVIFEQNNIRQEVTVSGERYSDVYIDILIEYPECNIISISELDC